MNIEMLLKSSFRGGEGRLGRLGLSRVRWRGGLTGDWPDRQIRQREGPGTRNEYSFDDIVRVGFMKALAKARGIPGRARHCWLSSLQRNRNTVRRCQRQ